MICKKKIKWLRRGSQKNNMSSKIVKKKIFWTHMMEMIPFYLIFSNVIGVWGCEAPQTPLSTYILSETIHYVYTIFRANRIISAAARHLSYISLASTNNIWGIKMTFKENMFLAPREYLSFTYFSLQFIPKKKKLFIPLYVKWRASTGLIVTR